MVDLDFQASRKRQPPFFRCNLPSIPFEPSFVATTNNIVNEKTKQPTSGYLSTKRPSRAVDTSWQLVLMSSFPGCIHHKSHDAIVVSEDDGIVRQIGQTSPKLLKTLQKTHSSNSPGNKSTTRKPSTTCSNSMSHHKQTSQKKTGDE